MASRGVGAEQAFSRSSGIAWATPELRKRLVLRLLPECSLRRCAKRLHLRSILHTRRTFHPARGIDRRRLHDRNRLGNILRSKPSRQNKRDVAEPISVVFQSCPISRFAGAAILPSDRRVDEYHIRLAALGPAGFEVVNDRLNATLAKTINSNDRQVAANIRQHLWRLVAMKLDPIEFDPFGNSVDFFSRGIYKDARRLRYLCGNGLGRNRLRLFRRNVARAVRIKIQPDHFGTRLHGGASIVDSGHATNFDSEHGRQSKVNKWTVRNVSALLNCFLPAAGVNRAPNL